jgi:hypothetical protein
VQKLFFLIDRKVGQQVGGPFFDFRPYHYGPFDGAVYDCLGSLVREDCVAVNNTAGGRAYRLTPTGQRRGEALLKKLDPRIQDFVLRTCTFVRTTPFADLVSSIYKAYPEMRANSIFRERRR